MLEQNELRFRIADAAINGIKQAVADGKIPADMDPCLALEAMILCMQTMGGPELTAQVVRYSFVMVSDR